MSGGKVIGAQVAVSVVPAASTTAASAAALAPVVAVAGVVIAAAVVAAGAVVLTRAAMSGLAWVGDRLEEDYVKWEAQQHQLDEWEAAYAKAVACNARLSRTRARAARGAGGDGDLPGPISPVGRSLREIEELCTQAQGRILAVEDRLAAEAVDRAIAGLPARSGTDATQLLARRLKERNAKRRPAAAPAAPAAPASAVPGAPFRPMVGKVVDKLDGDADADQCAEVLELAARVEEAGTDQRAAKRWLDALYLTIGQINEAVANRRDTADAAARLLEGLRADVTTGGLIAPERLAHHEDVRRRLSDVVAGDRELDAGLLASAQDAQAEVAAMTEQLLIRESWRATLAELGYDVTLEPQRAGTGLVAMTMTRPEWGGSTARMVVEGTESRAFFTQPGDDAQLRKWANDLMAIKRAGFADRGVELGELKVTRPAPPVENEQAAAAPLVEDEEAAEEERLPEPKRKEQGR